MSSSIAYANGSVTVTIPANESIAVYSKGASGTQVFRQLGYPNHPDALSLLGTVTNGQTVFGPYSSGATIIINPGADQALYSVGVSPVTDAVALTSIQGDPGVLNATGALTAALMGARIVTSTTAAAVAGTVPTGTVMDAAVDFAIGDSFDWSVINTGPNTFTVTAATDHTLVGAGAVATATSGRFRTRKTAAKRLA